MENLIKQIDRMLDAINSLTKISIDDVDFEQSIDALIEHIEAEIIDNFDISVLGKVEIIDDDIRHYERFEIETKYFTFRFDLELKEKEVILLSAINDKMIKVINNIIDTY